MRKNIMTIGRKSLFALSLSALAMALVPISSSHGSCNGQLRSSCTGVWLRTAAAINLGVECPQGLECVEWCEGVDGDPTGTFCCIVEGVDRTQYSACGNPI